MRALDTASTGMAAMDLQVQVIAGNIANMSTTGFKSQRAEFQDLIYEHVQRIGAQASDQGNILPVGIELGSGGLGPRLLAVLHKYLLQLFQARPFAISQSPGNDSGTQRWT